MKKRKDATLTELLHRYLEFLYQQHLSKIRGKVWMRNGDLDVVLGGQYSGQTLRELLCNHNTVTRDLPNIVILRGEKGDGRKFSIKKMIETCYENIHHLGWDEIMEKKTSLRFPVYVPRDTAAHILESDDPTDLVGLACKCLICQMELKGKEKRNAHALVSGLVREGKLACFFEEETANQALINCLSTPNMDHQPVAVFTELPSCELTGQNNIYDITMKPLTTDQIARYLTAELPELYPFQETMQMLSNQEVANILGKPEWLKLHTEVIKGVEDEQKRGDITTVTSVAQIYEAFLTAQINVVYKEYEGQGRNLPKKEALWLWLIRRAEGTQIQKEDKQYEVYFQKTSIFLPDFVEFRFEGCRYYLIAKGYMKRFNAAKKRTMRNRLDVILSGIFDGQNLMVLIHFAMLYTTKYRNRNELSKILFEALIDQVSQLDIREKYNKDPSRLLTDVLIFTKRVVEDGYKFIEWACEELGKSKYDTAVLEAIRRLSQTDSGHDIVNKLEMQYTTATDNRVKRRIAYCFGYMDQASFPDTMLRDLCNENVDLHLRYHISAALVDNCKTGVIEDIPHILSVLGHALSNSEDPILKSDFDTFYTQISHEQRQQYRTAQLECERQLIKILEDKNEEYWRKAHAAGALGRRRYEPGGDDLGSVVSNLVGALHNALEGIYQSLDGNELKAISYIVESCCRLAKNNQDDGDVAGELWHQLLSHLKRLPSAKASISAYNYMQVALKLLSTGLVYLQEGTSSIRTALGVCFSSEENLIQFLARHHFGDHQNDSQSLKKAIEGIRQWSSLDGAKAELKDISSVMEGMEGMENYSAKTLYSSAYLHHDNHIQAMGFLFFFQNSIYFVTCRHCLIQKGNNGHLTPYSFLGEDPNQISIFPMCLGSSVSYQGTLCYPNDLLAERSFDEKASQDIVIYRLHDILASFAQLIFSDEDQPADWDMKDREFAAFSINQTHGAWIECKQYESILENFFTVKPSKKIAQSDVNGFSGVPIIMASNMKTIIGMWKASKVGEADDEIKGINIRSIIHKLEQLAKNGGDYCE